MVNVSKQEISDDVKSHLYGQLADLFIANTTKKDFSQTLFELLSPTERIMLAKRVGIIGLLVHECSTYEISQIFKVSVGTILKLQDKLEKGSLKHIEAIFKRKKARESFLGMVEQLFILGMPGGPQKHLRSKTYRAIRAWRAGGK